MASVDIYLNASYRFEMLKNTTDLQANTRKFFKKFLNNDFFSKEEKQDSKSFLEFESNVRLVNWTLLGEIFIPLVSGNTIIWQTFVNQLAKSKAVILSSQEPLSSLVDHADFRKSIDIRTRKQIKEYLDGTSRTYVKRNSFKVKI